MRRPPRLSLLLLTTFAVALVACRTNTTPNPVAINDMMVFSYVSPPACLADNAFRCDRQKSPPRLNVSKWPVDYREAGSYPMVLIDGVYSVTVRVPQGRYPVSVMDTWLCPPGILGCVTEHITGNGISVKGVRLTDAVPETSFMFIAPDQIVK